MAWLELHEGMREHPKVIDLAERLGISEPHAAGLCCYLWTWALERSPDGVLRNSARMVSRACGWDGDQASLLSGLVISGLLDVMDADSLYIHDWNEYTGRFTAKRAANAERMRAARAKNKSVLERAVHVQRTNATRAELVQETCNTTCDERAGATVPNSTVQEQEQREDIAAASSISRPCAGSNDNAAADDVAGPLLLLFQTSWPKIALTGAERVQVCVWIDQYGAAKVREKILLLADRANVRRPFGALSAALASDWRQDLEPKEIKPDGINRDRHPAHDGELERKWSERWSGDLSLLRTSHDIDHNTDDRREDTSVRSASLSLPAGSGRETGGQSGGRGG